MNKMMTKSEIEDAIKFGLDEIDCMWLVYIGNKKANGAISMRSKNVGEILFDGVLKLHKIRSVTFKKDYYGENIGIVRLSEKNGVEVDEKTMIMPFFEKGIKEENKVAMLRAKAFLKIYERTNVHFTKEQFMKAVKITEEQYNEIVK